MNWTSTFALALVPAVVGAGCSNRESQAAPPKTAAKLPAQDHPLPPTADPATPPAPDANAATRRVAPQSETKATLESPPPQEATPPDRDAGAGTAGERLLSDEDAAIPTQEEANREAEQAISEENADAELEKLEKELGGGGG